MFKICKQDDLPADLELYKNSEGCLESHKNVPLQNYKAEIVFTVMITVVGLLVMVMLCGTHIKELLINPKVFPIISLTPIIMLHVFSNDVQLAEVVKLLVKRLF